MVTRQEAATDNIKLEGNKINKTIVNMVKPHKFWGKWTVSKMQYVSYPSSLLGHRDVCSRSRILLALFSAS